MKPRIYVDFMKMGDGHRVPLVCAGTHRDLKRFNITLREGMPLSAYCDDDDEAGRPDNLLADGVHFDASTNEWVLVVDESTFHHESDERAPIP